jgi:3-oxoadipate enol-lactonase
MNAVTNQSIAQSIAQFGDLRLAVDAATVAARVGGQGRPIVLFHSLLADDTSFDPIAGVLAQTHRVVILNLPGFGASDRVDGGLEQVADRVAAAIGVMDLDEAPIFLGNGYGGFVALMTAIRHPGIARRLVLADCGAAFSEPGRAAFRGMSAKARENGLAGISDIAMRRLFSPAYQAAHPELIEERRARFLAVDPETFHAACAALSTLDLRPSLAQVTVPVLVLAGEVDEATPPEMSRELAAGLPDASLQILPGCAHVPQLQEPAQFLDAIRNFVTP